MTVHLQKILAALAGKRFPLEDEKQTQAAVNVALLCAGLVVDREVPSPGGIIDFVVTLDEPSGVLRSMRFVHIGIEVKLKGQPAAIRRQLERYASDEMLEALILVTAKPVAMPAAIGGKPLAVFDLGRAWL